MRSISRKHLTIITEAVIEHELVADIVRLGATGYTITEARGRGHHGLRNSGIEAYANIHIEMVCRESVAQAIAAHFLEHYAKNYAMIMFMRDVDVLLPEKGNDGRQAS